MGLLELAQAVFLIELLAELSQVGDQQRAEDRGNDHGCRNLRGGYIYHSIL